MAAGACSPHHRVREMRRNEGLGLSCRIHSRLVYVCVQASPQDVHATMFYLLQVLMHVAVCTALPGHTPWDPLRPIRHHHRPSASRLPQVLYAPPRLPLQTPHRAWQHCHPKLPLPHSAVRRTSDAVHMPPPSPPHPLPYHTILYLPLQASLASGCRNDKSRGCLAGRRGHE